MKRLFRYIVVALPLLLLFSFILKKKPSAVDWDAMDTRVIPGDDFYRYANGTWLTNNPIPASEGRWGSFNIVAERNNEILRTLLEEAAADKSANAGSAKGKVGAFYRIYMDTLKRDQQGISPVIPVLKSIENLQDKKDLPALIAQLHSMGVRCFFNFYISQDLKNSTSYAVYISQGGLGLPDRDYYLKQDQRSISIREEYLKHMQAIHTLFNKNAGTEMQEIMNLETSLAKVCMTRTERRNQEKQYNKRALSQLANQWTALNLPGYFKANEVPAFDSLIVSQPDFFQELNKIIETTDLSVLKNYMNWCIMNQSSGMLDSKLENQNFKFYGTVLSGTKEQKPLWRRGIGAANSIVGELLGQMFVAKTFSPASKKRVNAMVDDIVAAYKVRITNLTWMSEATKVKALEKLAAFNRKFGYPDKWTDYSQLEIKEDSYYENSVRANQFDFKEMIGKLGKPIDRNRWGMLPQTVNAYYSPTLNEIVFPAAIMQPPFFNENAEDAVNYGSIGAVIGHELTHGFDDQGSKYGADGNLKSWWTDEDRKQFDARTKVLVEQFNNYFVADSLHVNGELTLGENIADLGGLTIAYEAFKLRLKKYPSTNINGFTPEQRFFLGFAQIWKNNSRPETMRQLILTDPHSPGEFRVFGPLSNMPQFYEAFGVKEGNKMFRSLELRVVIW